MAKINVLSKQVSELIAAGEVIDRPSSVIKELLENAIDSGATNIAVEIKNGGRTYMRITDNGEGMTKEDLPTAFLRHATSKIHDQKDLENITSLGFRGEALASICAVSKVNVLTKRRELSLGSRIVNEGGEVKLLEDCGCPDGTTVTVSELFYNVPARLKFLKKDVTEGNAIAAMINKIALSHPEISFKFIRDNKQELITAGDGSLYSAVYSVFGKSFAQSLIEVDHTHSGVHVSGYIVKPLQAKAKRTFQNFFINGRYVKSVTCMVSLEEAYRNRIMVGKFPACVLMIDIDPSLVDVNVHPAKVEVKFADEKLIYDAVYFAVKNALMKEDTPSELKAENTRHYANTQLYGFKENSGVQTSFAEQSKPSKTFETAKVNADESFFERVKVTEVKPMMTKETSVLRCDTSVYGGFTDAKDTSDDEKPDETPFEKIIPAEPREFKYINERSFEKKPDIAPAVIQDDEPEDFAEEDSIKVLGEVFDTYVVLQRGEDMYLLDKHAAHERINFEKIKSQMTSLNSQMLFSPVEVLLSYDEYDALMQNLDECKNFGFIIEDAGAPVVKVSGLPVIINSEDAEDSVGELARNYAQHRKSPQIDILDELCHSIACKASIKGNIPSRIEELEVLCKQAFDENLTKYCPHGRPIFIKFSRREIEKLFKRIV